MAIIIPTSHLVVFLAPVDRRCRNTPVPVGRSRLRRRRHLGALAMSDIFPPLLSHFFSLPSSIRLEEGRRRRDVVEVFRIGRLPWRMYSCAFCVSKRGNLDQLELNPKLEL